jgi:4-hydroxybenzoate polyprenyltransferase
MNRLARWGVYLREMFPPASRVGAALLSTIVVFWPARALHGLPVPVFDTAFWVGAATYLLVMLYYRLCDEFKDAETDRRYFPERPLPSGRVGFDDLVWLRGLTVAVMFALNLILPLALPEFLAMFAFAFLMGKWFYLPELIGGNRLLAFLTHAPVSLFGAFYLLALVTRPASLPLFGAEHWLIALWVSLPGYIWEILRKTRAPREERAGYQTYSVMIGYRACVAVGLALLGAHAALAAGLIARLGLGAGVAWGAAALAGLLAVALLRFAFTARRPDADSRFLRPATELYAGLSLALVGAALGLAAA